MRKLPLGIYEHKDKDGNVIGYRAHINRKGHKQQAKLFMISRSSKSVALKDATRWKQENDRKIDIEDLPLTIEQLKNETLGQLVKKYLDDVTPTKGSKDSESSVLKAFLRRDICKLSLAVLSRPDATKYAAEYRDMRLKEIWIPKNATKGRQVTPRTVRRELNSISHIFTKARTEWGYPNLNNPFEGLEVKGSQHRRTRRLREGEYDKLITTAHHHCRGDNKFYAPLVICLAVETGMRLQEIFNLTLIGDNPDIDWKNRRIRIRKSKTDDKQEIAGRTIVMTIRAWFMVMEIFTQHLYRVNDLKTCMLFPMSKLAFKQIWHDVVRKAGIEGLTFHDLRREAGSRFDELGLTKAEHDLMMGHSNKDMASLYISTPLKNIQDKLDKPFIDARAAQAAKGIAPTELTQEQIDQLYKVSTEQSMFDAIAMFRGMQKEKDLTNVLPFRGVRKVKDKTF